ncbi:MAG: nucleoside kinase [bacterium]|nr:nucleoside kinase [bacterium]
MNESQVTIRYQGEQHGVAQGTTVASFLQETDGSVSDRVLSALVNRRQVMLDFPLRGEVDLDVVRYGSREGELVYKRSVSLMLHEACAQLYPEAQLVIGQSLGNSYHYSIRGETPGCQEMTVALCEYMRKLHLERVNISRNTVTLEEVEEAFRKRGWNDKLLLLRTRRSSTVHTVSCGKFIDLAHGPYAPHTGCLPTFDVVAYEDGLLLRFPQRANRDQLPVFIDKPLLFKTYVETRKWQDLLGIPYIGQLNALALNGEMGQLVRIAEGFHEKKIARIADEISARRDRVRLIAIAGPSSSGKTTFAQRLGVQLRVNGLEPVALSLDNYYVNRSETPIDEDGKLDFESIEAIDLPLFHEHLTQLLDGKEVSTPRFDFVAGKRRPAGEWSPLRLGPGQMLVIEGIHGLNNKLTESLERDQKFAIYISALSQLAIDNHNRIFTADGRLIRRIVRDRMYRGFSAERTLDLWERVRRGEGQWIFPFQEEADIMFNSALVYEPAVLRIFAERFLLQVPRTSQAYPEAFRLLKFLSLFVPIFPDEVPHTSILREFVGGSSFAY